MAKILLVEDDNNLREIYEARLQAEGYTIISARDGEEALVFAKSEKPDLVISDVMMPKISGFEMLDILRNTEGLKHVKVIMLTALGQSDDQQRASRLGADHYLVKSQVTLEDIVKVAHELLEDTPTPMPEPVAAPSPAPAAPVVATPTPEIPAPTPVTTPEIPVASPVPVTTTPPVITAEEVFATTATPGPTPMPEPVAAPSPAPAAPVVATPTPEIPAPETSPLLSVAEMFSSATDTPISADNREVAAVQTEATPPEASVFEVPAEPPVSREAIVAEEQAVENRVAQSTAQEEASIEAKIEDFVAGASSDPSVPPTHENFEPTPEASIPEAIINSDPSDQQLPNKAVTPASPSPTRNPESGRIIRPSGSLVIPSPESAPSEEASGAPQTLNNNAINHRKVITPDEGAPKQDLGALLAKEAASYDATPSTAPSISSPVPVTPPPTPPPLPGAEAQSVGDAPPTPPPIDPNSIAL